MAYADVVQRGDPRPLRRRRRHRPDRRALMQARAEQARRYGVAASTARSTACRARPPCTSASATPPSSRTSPPAYRFLSELAASPVDQISIEAAQPGLDLSVLERCRGKTIILGVIDLDTARGRDGREGGRTHPPRAAPQARRRARRRARLRHEVPPARRRRSPSCRRWWPARSSCAPARASAPEREVAAGRFPARACAAPRGAYSITEGKEPPPRLVAPTRRSHARLWEQEARNPASFREHQRRRVAQPQLRTTARGRAAAHFSLGDAVLALREHG